MSRDLDLDAVVLVTALLLLVGAVAVATVPGLGVLVPPPLRGFGEFLGASLASWLVAFALALAALVGLGLLRGRQRAGGEAETSVDGGGGGSVGGGGEGGGVDAAEAGDDGTGSPGAEEILGGRLTEEFLRQRDDLRSRHGPQDLGPTDGLEHAAIAVQLARGHDAETAHERLRSGAWTDDPVAAAFLGDGTAGRLSFRRRLYSVIYPHRAFERRFERTLEELEAVAERTEGIGGGFDGDGTPAGESRETADDGKKTADEGRKATDEGRKTADEVGDSADEVGDTADEVGDTADEVGNSADEVGETEIAGGT